MLCMGGLSAAGAAMSGSRCASSLMGPAVRGRGCFVHSRIAPRPAGGRPGRSLQLLRASKSDTASKAPAYKPSSAKDAIETGTKALKESKDAEEAIRLFQLSLAMQPSEDEARAALYNMGCALAKQRRWAEATSRIVSAINDHGLKLVVALRDDDLQELRDRREWLDALATMKGAVSRSTKVDLRTEAKAPFRFPRVVLVGGLLSGAVLALLVGLSRLAGALNGGEGAPDLGETLQNLAINSGAVGVLGLVLYLDLKSKQKAVKVTTREELLGLLQVDLGEDRVLPLLKFRGQVRPVILAGSRAFLEGSLKEAEKQYAALRERGVSLVPIVFEPGSPEGAAGGGASLREMDPEERIRALKREFMAADGPKKGFSDAAAEDAARKAAAAKRKAALGSGIKDADKKWRLEPYNVPEWKAWLTDQKEFASLPAAEPNCYIQVQLDGTVRRSGTGMPPWQKFLDDLPALSDVRTRITDGVIPTD